MLLAVLTSIACVLLCVGVHLGVLLSTYRLVSPQLRTLHRATVGLIVLVAILGHLIEIALFGAGYVLLAPAEGGSGFNLMYHSAATYTSLGDSQLATAELRVMTAVEALTGLVLITWTASFTFLVMQKNWGPQDESFPFRAPEATSHPPTRQVEPTGAVADRL